MTRRRLARTAAIYACIVIAGCCLAKFGNSPVLQKLGLGLMLPGGGFLAIGLHGVGWFALSCAGFGFALALWFATGNVLAPPAAWLAAAFIAAADGTPVWAPAVLMVPFLAISGVTGSFLLAWASGVGALRKRSELNHVIAQGPASVRQPDVRDEIPLDDLRLMRVVLDRALQPVEAFDGFEWIDQFQTAAVRYQLSFSSYALSLASHTHLPALEGYMLQAQRNLALKQLDHRIWRYWRLENAWGRFNLSADPIPHDNIMLTGFLGTQLALARAASGLRDFDAPQSLRFEHPSGRSFAYATPALARILARQYERAPQGLLACEPNWIYPLCNTITAIGLRSVDAQFGSHTWRGVSGAFRRALEEEFITPAGRFVPFRSSLTGLAAPGVGGAVMQAFPCFFLNAVLPDIARRHWELARTELLSRNLSSVWPVDVGNYGVSKAAGLAACAAAAVEMGDLEVAGRLFDRLDASHARITEAGVTHRSGASLWAHAVELMARLNRPCGLQALAAKHGEARPEGPYLRDAAYPDILVAKAKTKAGALELVLHPLVAAGIVPLTIAGLSPGRSYAVRADGAQDHVFQADPAGHETLRLFLNGRTAIDIRPR